MRINKRIMAFLVVVMLIASMAIPASAQTSNKTVYPGDSVTVYFTYKDSFSLDGEFSYNDPNGIIEGTPDYRIYDRDGMVGGQISGNKAFMYDTSSPAVAHDVVLCVVLNIKSSAAVGSTCSVSFAYNCGTDATGMTVKSGTDTATVTVEKRPEQQGSTTTPTEPTVPEVQIDYTELERQLSVAEGLKQEDYTAETWQVFADALENAEALKESDNQDAIDAAAKQLAAAIAALVRMDYTALEEALENAKGIGETENLGELLTALVNAMINGEAQLEGNDQTAVDAAAVQINELIAQVNEAIGNLKTVETVIEEKIVEVEPSGPFCNIPAHRVWLIVMVISLILNVAFIVVIVIFVVKKKKNRKDTTPLVNYDITDDE